MTSADQRKLKDALYEQFARIGKALAASKRLELLDLLSQGPRTVEALAVEAALSIANASKHLQVLRTARLVEAEKRGLYVVYRLADDQVGDLLHALQGVAQSRLAEVESAVRAYSDDRGAMEAVARRDLMRRVKAGEVTVIDVRPEEEFHAGHIPGAISMPVADLKTRMKELPKDKEIVAYCRGPYCVMAIEAVHALVKRGYRAQRMEAGVLDWKARGWRIETST